MAHDIEIDRNGTVLHVIFNRPSQRNAMTWEMYDELYRACDLADEDDSIRSVVVRGAHTDAFVSGTDIGQFAAFSSGEDGVSYEHRITQVLDRVQRVRKPTVAAVSGYCIGAGLGIAAACDVRIATPTARFGAPIARTVGNCLSVDTCSLLVYHLGPGRTLDILLTARLIDAEEARAIGFVSQVVAVGEIDHVVTTLTNQLDDHAPLSMWAAKEAVRRIRDACLPNGDDLVQAVYSSHDFHHGVASFASKTRPAWQGR